MSAFRVCMKWVALFSMCSDSTGCYTGPLYSDSPPLPAVQEARAAWSDTRLNLHLGKQGWLSTVIDGGQRGTIKCGSCGGCNWGGSVTCYGGTAFEAVCPSTQVCMLPSNCLWERNGRKLTRFLPKQLLIWLSCCRWIIHKNNGLFSLCQVCLPCLFSMR